MSTGKKQIVYNFITLINKFLTIIRILHIDINTLRTNIRKTFIIISEKQKSNKAQLLSYAIKVLMVIVYVSFIWRVYNFINLMFLLLSCPNNSLNFLQHSSHVDCPLDEATEQLHALSRNFKQWQLVGWLVSHFW